MLIREVMTQGVHTLDCTATLREAAQLMSKHDIGSVPVSRDDRLVGMVTDRDIVLRGVARGISDDAPLSDVMSDGIKYCFDDQSVSDVASNMAQLGVRRLPVVDRDKRLVGFVSLSNIHGSDEERASEELLDGTARAH